MNCKWRISSVLCAASIVFGCANPNATARDFPRRNFARAESWCLYYGADKSGYVERLGQSEIVVIDPHALGETARDTISALKDKGCVVIGYLSCFEVAAWHRYLSRVPAEWRVKVDGRNWIPWGNNEAASLSIPEWRDLLVELVQSEVLDYGCDGVFMDTIADLDSSALPEDQRAIELDGLDKLLAAFRETYPDKVFIANWTLQWTLPVVAKYVDAVCWEGFRPDRFDGPDKGTATWMKGIAAKIAEQQAAHPFKVLSLWCEEKPTDETPFDQVRMVEISYEYGYLPYCCTYSYGHPLP